jgi:hypothetical protein
MRPLSQRTPIPSVLLVSTLAAALCGCQADLGERLPQSGGTFGAIVYREACQRVTYSADLEARALSSQVPLDASGATRRALCAGNAEPAPSDAPQVKALHGQRAAIVSGVDGALPESLLPSFDAYLRALSPLQDDGTVTALLARSGALLKDLAADGGFVAALTRLGQVSGTRHPSTAGGLIRSATAAPSLDDVTGATLALLVKGGAARAEFQALLRAAAFELRHLTQAPDKDLFDPERTPRLLLDLLLSRDGALAEGKPLPLCLRDARGLPLLAEVVPPYVADPRTGLARADDVGRFLDGAGKPIPYVSPLPEPGPPPRDDVRRDAEGRALRADGKPLYRYVDLDGTLLHALLREGQRLFPEGKDVALGALPGLALLSGSRPADASTPKEKGGERLLYRGFQAADAPVLDLMHGLLQVLRFQTGGNPAGKELDDLLRGVRALLQTDPDGAREAAKAQALAHAARGLTDALLESQKPQYAAARIPADSTLLDDLAPILARLAAVPDREEAGKKISLVEDLLTALADPHVKNLGPMTAQLLSERGYFFMRQIGDKDGLDELPRACAPDPDEANNGLTPCGVVGRFGNRPDRAAPDADATQDWRSKKTAEPGNNRSVLQRMVHTLADTNGGRPFCNGRNASIFGGFVVFHKECDMFQVDNVAQFFLLSIASPALRRDETTFAKGMASFREAIRNGRDCRCVSGSCEDPDAKRKCDALLTNIDDGINGDKVLAGLMGIDGFGRYPEPAAGARALFLDLSRDVASVRRTRALLFNHVVSMAGALEVDPADPDNRKFIDGAGKDRLMIDEHNGVLFALEKVRGPQVFADGTRNQHPDDNYFDALRPLVDAFARHAECFERSMAGTCTRGQNAVQILADAMTVLHRHWGSARSQVFGRGFAASYGPLARPDGAQSYEPLGAALMNGELLLGAGDLTPILRDLTVDGQPVAALVSRLLRFLLDPSQAPAGLAYRDGKTQALRADGKPAYDDPVLARVLGADPRGKVTPLYLLLPALRRVRAAFDLPENQAAKERWDRALSDGAASLLAVRTMDGMNGRAYRFESPRLRLVGDLLVSFLQGRVQAHRMDLAGWSQRLLADAQDVTTGPLYAGLVDLGAKVDADSAARDKLYALLRELLDEKDAAGLRALTAAAADGAQLLLDDGDLVPIGRALSGGLDPVRGPVDPALELARRGHDIEQASKEIEKKPVLVSVLRNLYTPDGTGLYPMYRLSDAIGEVNRARPGQGGAFAAEDYTALLKAVGAFLIDQQRGMTRFIEIVQGRRVPQ